eukprot:362571-Chlamydomonas_euryale.AAC.2
MEHDWQETNQANKQKEPTARTKDRACMQRDCQEERPRAVWTPWPLRQSASVRGRHLHTHAAHGRPHPSMRMLAWNASQHAHA